VLGSVFTDGGGASLVLVAWAVAYRALVLRRARRLVIADQARYEAAWGEAADGPDGRRALSDLGDAARAAAAERRPRDCSGDAGTGGGGGITGGGQPPRQLVRQAVAAPHAGGGGEFALLAPARSLLNRSASSSSPGASPPPPVPLTNLDVLYVQAVLLHPILANKALGWAAASRGWFPRAAEPGAQAEGGSDPSRRLVCPAEEPQGEIKWARVKRVARAYEKMQRAYRAVRAAPPAAALHGTASVSLRAAARLELPGRGGAGSRAN
jgi:hypothetical protein